MTTKLTRRNFLAASGSLSLTAALLPTIVTRANAKAMAGELAMVPVTPNAKGAFDKLYMLHGDPLAGPINTIVTQQGKPAPQQLMADGEQRILRIMHFNDMHNHLTEFHSKKGDTHRFSQIVKMVKQAKAEAKPNEIVLFVSGGDDHTGSIFDELMGWNPEEFVVDAGYKAYSEAGLDISVLGNHEFDRGARQLKQGLERDCNFPVLSANVHGSKDLHMNKDYAPAALAEVNGLRIGFIGLTTAIDTRVGQENDPDLAVASPVTAIKNIYSAVEAVSDVVVILSHCGYGKGKHISGKAATARMIGEGDFAIAEAVSPMINKPVVLIGGHSHTLLNAEGIDTANMVGGLLLTQAKAHGRYLGDISMSIAANKGQEGWFNSVQTHATKKRDQRVASSDPKFSKLEQEGDYDQEFETSVIAPMVSALETKLSEVIGRVTDDTLINTERTVNDRYIGESALANFMNDTLVKRSATFPSGKVDFALFNATGLSKGVGAGALSFRQWFDVMPYADAVHVARMSGAQIRDFLNSNAKRLLRPEEVAQTDRGGFVSRGFLHFSSGIRYELVLGNSAAEAYARNITLNGTPIERVLDKEFTIAFNTYISLGGFGEAWNGKPIGGGVAGDIASMDVRNLDYDNTGLVYRNEIIAAIRDMKDVSPKTGVILDKRLKVVK
ncbi:bifunctional metallophosphatase/5'-nucleotidase [Polycladidibacter stylochi]|uniref:bifunctional metallophosphatase/5'-nucleotidase n=1 Tax=Polycladidibacter stylochi TaxID=1807766 RepID=UPI000B1F7243|nr:5'-nucleotidase C-terminal domain-containing protein [Pseudovibrio stylochi]